MNVLCALLVLCATHTDPPPPVAFSNPVQERPICAEEGDHKIAVWLDGQPKTYDAVKQIRRSVREAEGIFPGTFRWVCNDHGHLFVEEGNVHVTPANWESDTFYVTFKPSGGPCGWGTVGQNFTGPQFASIHCWGGWVTLHEIGHMLGAVAQGAPHSDGGWHCNEGQDVMCYSQAPTNCRWKVHFDCEGGDYFDPSPHHRVDTWLFFHPGYNTANSPWVNHGN